MRRKFKCGTLGCNEWAVRGCNELCEPCRSRQRGEEEKTEHPKRMRRARHDRLGEAQTFLYPVVEKGGKWAWLPAFRMNFDGQWRWRETGAAVGPEISDHIHDELMRREFEALDAGPRVCPACRDQASSYGMGCPWCKG